MVREKDDILAWKTWKNKGISSSRYIADPVLLVYANMPEVILLYSISHRILKRGQKKNPKEWNNFYVITECMEFLNTFLLKPSYRDLAPFYILVSILI